MPLPNYTDCTILLDKSGSMMTLWEETITNYNNFIQEQRSIPGDGCFSLLQFDHQYEVHYSALDQHKVPPLNKDTYHPTGWTALIDALCRTINDTGRRLLETPEHLRPSKVLLVTITDGQENHSTKFTKYQLAEMIRLQRSVYSWEFLFLGANQDAIMTADSYGIPKGNAYTWTANVAGSQACFEKTSGGLRSYKLDGNTTGENFLSSADPDIQVNVTVNP